MAIQTAAKPAVRVQSMTHRTDHKDLGSQAWEKKHGFPLRAFTGVFVPAFLRVLYGLSRCSYGFPTGFCGAPTCFIRFFSSLQIHYFLTNVVQPRLREYYIVFQCIELYPPLSAKEALFEWHTCFFLFCIETASSHFNWLGNYIIPPSLREFVNWF